MSIYSIIPKMAKMAIYSIIPKMAIYSIIPKMAIVYSRCKAGQVHLKNSGINWLRSMTRFIIFLYFRFFSDTCMNTLQTGTTNIRRPRG